MGILWETYQEIANQRADRSQDQLTMSLAERVAWLEQAVIQQNTLIGMLIQRLETRLGEDLDGDQRIG